MQPALIVHGGAWDIPDDEVDANIVGVRAALAAGWQVLQAGGTALAAVIAAARVMEDDPTFDAGVGSVLNRDGDVELDAALMEGATLRSGAVAAVRRIKNPIVLAERVLQSKVVLLVAEGAERFATEQGIELCDPAVFITAREQHRYEEICARGEYDTPEAFGGHDTVGAVALDIHGNLAAATTTGGVSHKPAGRVGDSPLIGAGLYADNLTGGCSTTGWGESIIKVLLAKTATDMIGAGREPMAAAAAAVEVLATRVGGLGGLIVLDTQGRVGMAHNTPRMSYAYRVGDDEEQYGV